MSNLVTESVEGYSIVSAWAAILALAIVGKTIHKHFQIEYALEYPLSQEMI